MQTPFSNSKPPRRQFRVVSNDEAADTKLQNCHAALCQLRGVWPQSWSQRRRRKSTSVTTELCQHTTAGRELAGEQFQIKIPAKSTSRWSDTRVPG